MRKFKSGSTRDSDENKLDFDGFLSPLVLERYAQYMHKHRIQADGKIRPSDNWKKGIPKDAYMKSGWRHFFDWWKEYRSYKARITFLKDGYTGFFCWWKEHSGYKTKAGIEDALCALMFNAMGYLHELLKDKK